MGYGHANAPGTPYPEFLAAREEISTAASTANAAKAAAEGAQTTADAAMEKADGAENAASDAQTTATEALEAATAAGTAASNAQTTAEGAQTTATEAKTTAEEAAAAAAAAQEAADAANQAVTDLNSTVNTVPSQSGTLSYTGSVQSPSWNGYDETKLTISGVTSATDVGDYEAIFSLLDGYKWGDGTTDDKTVTWSIGRATVSVPTVSSNPTYTGSSVSPTLSGYDSAKMTQGGTTSATDVGSYTMTFTVTDNYQWPDGTTASKSVSWSISKATGSLSLSATSATITSKSAYTLTATRSGDGAVSAKSSDTSVATVSVSGNIITVTPLKSGSAVITVSVAAGTNYTAPASQTCSVTVNLPKIYGAQWAGGSSTAWTRTDDAALFTDPVPYVSGASSYSSPFDDISPWKDITRVTDSTGGELVKIPKFWYKWTKSGNTLKLQISPEEQDGFYVSPAHADRGDGKGERDVVYVGRYHCCSTYKSTTGQSPQASITRATARSKIKALGTGFYQFDLAMRVTIWMLYLVEFADWNSQAKIGYGCGNNSAAQSVGASDSMPYHTGTMQTSRTTYGVGVQYRYIEGLWGNVYDWMDGCYYSSAGLNVIENPENFSDSANGTSVGTPVGGYPTVMAVSTVDGLEWVIYPSASGGGTSNYVPDYWNFSSSNPCLFVGGYWYQHQNDGLFFVYYNSASDTYTYIGCRLQKLP